MSAASDFPTDENEPGADKQTSAMKDQLRQEVAAWNKQRDEPSAATPAVRLSPTEHAPRRVAAEKKKAAPAPAAAKPAVPSRPFSMSYDGQTQAEYQKARLGRKSR